jgi:hypothetical protein
MKNIFIFCKYEQNPKTSVLSALVYIIALVRGTRQELALQVAGKGLKKLNLLFLESSILTPSHPCGENFLATSLCT